MAPVGPLFDGCFIVTRRLGELGMERAREASCFPLGSGCSNRARERGKRARLVSLEGSASSTPFVRPPARLPLPPCFLNARAIAYC